MFGRLAKKKLEETFGVPVFWVKNFADGKKLLDMPDVQFSMALLDFYLADAPEGEMIKYVISKGISAFVFTGELTENDRKRIWDMGVADYALKEDPNSLDYIVKAMWQLHLYEETPVLVVADDRGFRNRLAELLYVRRFRVLTAAEGESALKIITQYPDIKLILMDYSLGDMDGFSLCRDVREQQGMEELAIIGFAPGDRRDLGAQFIKRGANDFIIKEGFLVEELYMRANRCLESIFLVKEMKELTVRDPLTGLHNRKYLFDAGKKMLIRCKRKNEIPFFAMIGIDGFKEVNDTYGYVMGDRILNRVGCFFSEIVRDDEVGARLGGSDFCLMTVSEADALRTRLQCFREKIASYVMAETDDGPLKVTVTIGCWQQLENDMDAMITYAGARYLAVKNDVRGCLRME